MNSLKVALLQLLSERTLQGNLIKGLDACRQAKAMGADIALFPEMWSTGYSVPQDKDELQNAAISLDSAFMRRFEELAKELNMAIGITMLEKYDPSATRSSSRQVSAKESIWQTSPLMKFENTAAARYTAMHIAILANTVCWFRRRSTSPSFAVISANKFFTS